MQIPRGEHPFRINMTNPRFSICNNILFPWDVSCCQLNITFHSPLPYPNSQIMTIHRMWVSHFINARCDCGFVTHDSDMFSFSLTESLKSKKNSFDFLNILKHFFLRREQCSTCRWTALRGSPTLKWSISINHFANFYFPHEFKRIKNIVFPPFYFLQSILGQIYPSIKISFVGFKKIILIFQHGSVIEWPIFISWKCWSQSDYKTCNIPNFQILLFLNWLTFIIYLFLAHVHREPQLSFLTIS